MKEKEQILLLRKEFKSFTVEEQTACRSKYLFIIQSFVKKREAKQLNDNNHQNKNAFNLHTLKKRFDDLENKRKGNLKRRNLLNYEAYFKGIKIILTPVQYFWLIALCEFEELDNYDFQKIKFKKIDTISKENSKAILQFVIKLKKEINSQYFNAYDTVNQTPPQNSIDKELDILFDIEQVARQYTLSINCEITSS